jgi:lipopolysaccharide transport system permease protein
VVGLLAAIWRYRRMFWILTVRSLFHVYRNAILGVLWVAIQPLVVALSAVFVIGKVFGISVDPLPLPLFVLVGLAGWILFRRSIQWMTKSMNSSRALLRTVYMPPLLLVIATISQGLFQLLVVLTIAGITAIYYGAVLGQYHVPLGWHLLAVFPAMLLILMLATAIGCFTSILNVFARDTWLTLRYLLGGLMIVTPIVYPVTVIPEHYRWIAYLNPLAPAVDLFRWALLGYGQVPWPYLVLSAVEALIVLLFGLWFFARMQSRLFDHL